LTGIGQQTSAGWQYFNTDGLGSVRQMTDASGAVAYAASYEPYGTPFDQWPNPQSAATVGYTGEQNDSNDLVYLRARYYDPHLGIFLSKDPFEGTFARSISQNGYAYAGSNPVNYTDPSGRCFDPVSALACIAIGLSAGAIIGAVRYTATHNGANWNYGEYWGTVGQNALLWGTVAAAFSVAPGLTVAGGIFAAAYSGLYYTAAITGHGNPDDQEWAEDTNLAFYLLDAAGQGAVWGGAFGAFSQLGWVGRLVNFGFGSTLSGLQLYQAGSNVSQYGWNAVNVLDVTVGGLGLLGSAWQLREAHSLYQAQRVFGLTDVQAWSYEQQILRPSANERTYLQSLRNRGYSGNLIARLFENPSLLDNLAENFAARPSKGMQSWLVQLEALAQTDVVANPASRALALYDPWLRRAQLKEINWFDYSDIQHIRLLWLERLIRGDISWRAYDRNQQPPPEGYPLNEFVKRMKVAAGSRKGYCNVCAESMFAIRESGDRTVHIGSGYIRDVASKFQWVGRALFGPQGQYIGAPNGWHVITVDHLGYAWDNYGFEGKWDVYEAGIRRANGQIYGPDYYVTISEPVSSWYLFQAKYVHPYFLEINKLYTRGLR
jgi:RHS repeat-associated protein